MKKRTLILLSLLILTSFVVGALGYGFQRCLLEPLGIQREEHPVALPFVLLADKILQSQIEAELELLHNPPTEPITTESAATEPTTVPTEAPTEVPTEPEIRSVEDSWFDDALFIGESRIQGMQVFNRLGTADYFCAASMTVYGVLDAKLSDDNFTDATLDEVLNARSYGKVYIHLGINEVPVGADGILRGYQKIIDRIRALEPEAHIVLIGCMSITREYSEKMRIDMETVHELNDKLRTLAESEPEIFSYVDTNSWAAGEDGFLRPELTHDGCHLYGELYADWCNLLKEEAVSYNIP